MLSNTMSFLYMIEHTKMTKSYKAPVLLSLIQGNSIIEKIRLDDLAVYFKSFYADALHRLDLNDLIHEDFEMWSNEKLDSHIIRNPISALINTSSDLFFYANEVFGIKQSIYEDLILDNAHELIDERIQKRLADYYFKKYKVVL
jgi:hypothetical protein